MRRAGQLRFVDFRRNLRVIAKVPRSRSTGPTALAPTVTLVTDPALTKMMSLRYAGTCSGCGVGLPAGVWAAYDRVSRTVTCARCSTLDPDDQIFQAGTAGGSAQREFEKRKDKRETRIRAQHPRLGGVILALTDEPQRTRAWATGAEGEVVLGRRLDAAVGVRVLHDRRIPGSKANIDHIVIGRRGVFVIDAKHYKGGPTLRTSGGLFSPRVEKLVIGSRDHTSLVAGVHKQVRLVGGALESAGLAHVPTFGMLCFVEADWPLLGGDFMIDNVEVLWPRKAVSRVTSQGSFGSDEIEAAFRALAASFPPA